MKGVVADFVAFSGYQFENITIFIQSSVLTDNEECDLEIPAIENFKHVWDKNVKIRRKFLPARITMTLHI